MTPNIKKHTLPLFVVVRTKAAARYINGRMAAASEAATCYTKSTYNISAAASEHVHSRV